MPPRYAYWTIIAGGLPTAFRAADRDELMPTFHRIKEKHPDAQMKWFARGKLWESPEAARVTRVRRTGFRDQGSGTRDQGSGSRDQGSGIGAGQGGGPQRPTDQEKRGRDWRPGGEHRDPRQKFVDAKKQRNAAVRKDRWDRKNKPAGPRSQGSGPRDGQGTKPPEEPGRPPRRPFRPRGNFGKGPRRS